MELYLNSGMFSTEICLCNQDDHIMWNFGIGAYTEHLHQETSITFVHLCEVLFITFPLTQL